MEFAYLKSPVGVLQIVADSFAVYEINLVGELKKVNVTNAILKLCLDELYGYFSLNLKEFKTPIKFSGTDFSKRVYSELLKIPYGTSITYKELAKRVGKPLAYRAVANANAKNKIPIIVPCHRVVATNGLGGYSGFNGVDTKRFLLDLESGNLKLHL